MHSPILDLARDPSCILAVTPHFGGSWWSPLRSGGGCPWPSPAPRNFAAEPAIWHYFAVMYNSIGTRDFQFELTAIIDGFDVSENRVFFDTAYATFGLVINNKPTNNFYFYCKNLVDGLAFYYVSASKVNAAPQYNAEPLIVGKNYFKIKRTGATLEVTVNDYTFSATGTAVLTPSVASLNTFRSLCGKIEKSSLSIENKTVWSYPSEAERVRLLTYDNVRTDRGVFEAANNTIQWSVVTPLRWSSLRAATVAIRTTADAVNSSLFQMGATSNPNAGKWCMRIPSSGELYASIRGTQADGAEKWASLYAPVTLSPDQKHVFAVSFDIDANAIAIYMDGVLLKSATMGTIIHPCPDDPIPGFLIGALSTSDGVNAANRTDWALVFDRALKPAEIAAISQC